ncbi:YdiU family protein [Azonexus sp.]|uniref:protein adenylyltransferase SelO n=1 Tax=Azonexus sp. TaxID=1872668 RepID=UPI0035AF7ED3
MPDLFTFDNSYARELADFCVRWPPAAASQPLLRFLNNELARELGADPAALASEDGVAALVGNRVPQGAEPVAQAYAGHQFGGFSPQLGDGRALLLGEVIDRQGQRRDIAFKGSGRTPFSRSGDGKCALGPALREALIGEAMHALGIPTTRALAVVATGDPVRRERALPGAVLTRVAASHVRVGTFEFLAQHLGEPAVRRLADYVIARHGGPRESRGEPYRDLLQAVAERQAELVARWLGVGFIHGVMNTDNMTISGETIDYGPCAFLEAYDPAAVFSSIDRQGRYAYGRQAAIAQWNLARFAETLLPLLDAVPERAVAIATEIIEAFPGRHASAWLRVFRAKLGIDERGDTADDRCLIEDFLTLLQTGADDFTLAFRALYELAAGGTPDLIAGEALFAAWRARWQARQPQRPPQLLAAMRCANPLYIARNHQVEAALDAAVDGGDFAPFERLLEVVRQPFDARPDAAAYATPAPAAFTDSYRTFCGT